MVMVQAMGLTSINLVQGALNDANGASETNPAGYTPIALAVPDPQLTAALNPPRTPR